MVAAAAMRAVSVTAVNAASVPDILNHFHNIDRTYDAYNN